MKRNLLISLIICSITLTSFQLIAEGGITSSPAQTVTLSGHVKDLNTGESLAGVVIRMEGTDIKTYTDFDGNFIIKNLKPGTYNVVASFISYKKSLIENIDIKAGNTEDVEIHLHSSK